VKWLSTYFCMQIEHALIFRDPSRENKCMQYEPANCLNRFNHSFQILQYSSAFQILIGEGIKVLNRSICYFIGKINDLLSMCLIWYVNIYDWTTSSIRKKKIQKFVKSLTFGNIILSIFTTVARPAEGSLLGFPVNNPNSTRIIHGKYNQ
jgi:hypothetical protein